MNSSKHRRLDSALSSKLARLREKLQLARDLDEISTFFHTVLVPDDDFIMASSRAHHPRLVQTLEAILSVLAPGGRSCSPLILRIEREGMCHGYANWQGGHAIFFYFETLDMGFCSFARSLTDPEVTFSRFTLAAIAGGACWNTASCGSA